MVATRAKTDTLTVQRRPQAERRAESDRRMMRAALKLIAEKGSSGISMAQIGLEAGYSRGLPAERFGNKVALLEAVVDFSDQKRGRLTLIRDLLDRLPDTHVPEEVLDWPALGHESLAPEHGILKPIPDYPIE